MIASKKLKVLRFQAGKKSVARLDHLAEEEPLEIRVETVPISVTMRTPGHDDELAVGFLVSEGLIYNKSQIAKISVSPRNRDKNLLDIFLAPDVKLDLKQFTRHVFASSSCGLCGKATIAAVQQKFPRIHSKLKVRAEVLLGLSEKLRAAQSTFDLTGGLHGAGLFDASGKLLVAREDVGRHNAVDKVIGHELLHGQFPLSACILMVSGRASFEIMQKALAAGIPIVAAVSAPSRLAGEFARANGQTLLGFVREQRMNIYSHPSRVQFGVASKSH